MTYTTYKTMKPILFAALTLTLTGAAHAATITETFTNTTGSVIPDGDLSGLVQSINPSTTISTIDSITVTLNSTGGWNGDLYAYLWHGGEISVLINRIGRTALNPAGSASGGMSVIFDLTAGTDIHSAPVGFGSSIIGNFQPDGRNIHPNDAFDTTLPTAWLDVFIGDAAAGEYRLYFADVASGDEATLVNWSITLTGTAIPEPSTAVLGALAVLGLSMRRRRC